MNTLDVFERIFAWTGFAAVLVVLGAIFLGIWRGLRRPVGQSTGQALGVLRSPVFYVLASLVYFGLLAFLWRPLPLALSSSSRVAALLAGVLLFFPGLALVLWGRLALGRSYFVSTALGAQLYADHRLITTGPFAIVRHPMYLGLVMTGFGGVFLYRTWAFAFVAVSFLGLALRARREEQALQAAFGEQWSAYRSRVPAFIPHLSWHRLNAWLRTLPPGLLALLEVCLLFLPSIPAYIWLWPNVTEQNSQLVQSLVYLYVLLGTIFIGRRRWNWRLLGVNWNGFWLSLACGLALIAGRSLVILSVRWAIPIPAFNLVRVLGEAAYYFLLVGITEELLYRGLLYRAFEDWLGVKWAIWGSSIGFMLWHIFGQGPLVGAATLFYGLIFALLRWRAGGIFGLIVIHGLIDFSAAQILPDINVLDLGRPALTHPAWMWIGLGLIVLVPLYLWKLHLLTGRILHRSLA